MDLDAIQAAIIAQESGGKPGAGTSRDSAVGPGQILPETFALYARPGEQIGNPAHNLAVSKRIVADYYSRYGGDPERIATAYFSGPGNVAPPGAPKAYLQDRADGNGKRVSSYVSNISGRLSKMASDDFDPKTAFSQWETPKAAPAEKFDPKTAFSQWEKPTQAAPSAPASYVPVPVANMTPQQLAEYRIGLERGKNPPSWLSDNYHPLDSISKTVGEGIDQLKQGWSDIRAGQPATGVGNLVMGGVNAALGPVLGPYNETFRALGQAIGQPKAAEIASLAVPTAPGLGAVKSALPAARAGNKLVELIGGHEAIPETLARLKSDPNLSLMDVSQPVKTVAAGLANSPETPKAQSIMRQAYETRTSDRQNIVQSAVDKTLGPSMNVKDVSEQLSENLKKVGEKLINPALEGAHQVGVLPILQRLDAVIESPSITAQTQEQLARIRKQIAVNGDIGFVDPTQLHNIQWPIRAFAENLAKSTSGVERNMAGPIMAVRNDLVDAIDVASGGKYKPALAQYRHASMVPEAMDKGFNILKTGGMEDFPEYWKDWAKNASPQEIMAARVGAISKVRQTIEGMQSGARRGEAVLNPTFIKERFSSIFSPGQVKELETLLNNSKNMAETNALLYQNSKTGLVTAGREYLKPRQVGGGAAAGIGSGLAGAMATAAGIPEAGLVGLLYGAGKTAKSGAQYLGNLSDKATATKFAKLVSASGGPAKDEAVKILEDALAANQSKSLIPSLLRLAAP